MITDTAGTAIGSFFIRDPNATPAPLVKIKTGTKVFKLSSSSLDEKELPSGYLLSEAEAQYSSSGTVKTFDNVSVTVRNPPTTTSSTAQE